MRRLPLKTSLVKFPVVKLMQYEQSSVYNIDGISIVKINEITDFAVFTVRSFIITQIRLLDESQLWPTRKREKHK